MPVVSVHRYAVAGGIPADTGLQSGDTLNLPSTGTVEVGFDSTAWAGAAANTAYTIFSFTTINNFTTGRLVANATDLAALGFSSAVFDQVGNTITVTFST